MGSTGTKVMVATLTLALSTVPVYLGVRTATGTSQVRSTPTVPTIRPIPPDTRINAIGDLRSSVAHLQADMVVLRDETKQFQYAVRSSGPFTNLSNPPRRSGSVRPLVATNPILPNGVQ